MSSSGNNNIHHPPHPPPATTAIISKLTKESLSSSSTATTTKIPTPKTTPSSTTAPPSESYLTRLTKNKLQKKTIFKSSPTPSSPSNSSNTNDNRSITRRSSWSIDADYYWNQSARYLTDETSKFFSSIGSSLSSYLPSSPSPSSPPPSSSSSLPPPPPASSYSDYLPSLFKKYTPTTTSSSSLPVSSLPPPPPPSPPPTTPTTRLGLIPRDWRWLIQTSNPYNVGNTMSYHSRSTLLAARSLVSFVPSQEGDSSSLVSCSLTASGHLSTVSEDDDVDHSIDRKQPDNSLHHHHPIPSPLPSTSHSFDSCSFIPLPKKTIGAASDAETASRLAEGTIRALRDLVLDEAVELNESLRFWMERWERPTLSWIEAGPFVWFSSEGYNHELVGRKVSRIQAVLARRCESIGELQQHLLRAGWQQGVAQWGVLGQGGQWATVVGSHLPTTPMTTPTTSRKSNPLNIPPPPPMSSPHPSHHQQHHEQQQHYNNIPPTATTTPSSPPPTPQPSSSYMSEFTYPDDNTEKHHNHPHQYQISKNDSALAAWTVDSIRVVRDYLSETFDDDDDDDDDDIHQSSRHQLPYHHHWHHESSSDDDDDNTTGQLILDEDSSTSSLPIWATPLSSPSPNTPPILLISNLSLLTAEVSALLDTIEHRISHRRKKLSEKIKPSSSVYRRWYVYATVVPMVGYMIYDVVRHGSGVDLMRHVVFKVRTFYEEHVAEPLRYIIFELFTGKERRDITDQLARQNATQSLQVMLQSWLDETHPHIPLSERQAMAQSMDISLVEKKKEHSIAHALYELPDIVRMSFIEMQFIKKELMTAMNAMDDLMESNEINLRIAAMAPTVLVLYGAKWCFELFFYALLRLGNSREEVYASLRHVVLDVERLLVMRNDPPGTMTTTMAAVGWGDDGTYGQYHDDTLPSHHPSTNNNNKNNTLDTNDLGMLMLLIHECRTIIHENRRRFTRVTLKNVVEDLAELAGERGAVSVKQQLYIVSRMTRTYPFLKVVSTGVPLDVSRFI